MDTTMKALQRYAIAGALLIFASTHTTASGDGETTAFDDLRAFPTAEGFGRFATGGRGGEVRIVSNLNDDGPGSLRTAWETRGAAMIVFEVAGTVNLKSTIHPTDNKTIAGETAFRNGGAGITLRRSITRPQTDTFSDPLVAGAFGNQIIRHLRFRRGPGVPGECCGDNFEPYKGIGKIIIDHCSFSWGTDEQLSFADSSEYTVQYSIISEGLMFATHSYSTPGHPDYSNSPHSMGSLNAYSTNKMSWYGNYFAHNNQRNALFAQFTSPTTELEFVNNLIYNWGAFGIQTANADNSDYHFNFINNLMKRGVNSSARRWGFTSPTNSAKQSHEYYVSGNISFRRPGLNDPEYAFVGDWTDNAAADTHFQVFAPHDYHLHKLPLLAAAKLESQLLPHVGAYLRRDAVDSRVVADFVNGTGRLIDHPDDVGGYPVLAPLSSIPVDTDRDGMPDAWETRHGVSSPSDIAPYWKVGGTTCANPGYTNLEVYLFTVAGDLTL